MICYSKVKAWSFNSFSQSKLVYEGGEDQQSEIRIQIANEKEGRGLMGNNSLMLVGQEWSKWGQW